MSPTPVPEGCPRVAVTRGGTAGLGCHSLPAQTCKGTWQLLEHRVAFPWHREGWGGGLAETHTPPPPAPTQCHRARARG